MHKLSNKDSRNLTPALQRLLVLELILNMITISPNGSTKTRKIYIHQKVSFAKSLIMF